MNDVLVAALSQAMNDYCKRRDCPMLKKHGDKIRCNAMILVGFPSKELHNGFCPIPLDLGVGMKGPRDRIAHTHRVTSNLKSSLDVSYVFVTTVYVVEQTCAKINISPLF